MKLHKDLLTVIGIGLLGCGLVAGCGGGGGGGSAQKQRFVFAASMSADTLYSFRREANQSLDIVGSIPTGDEPVTVVVTPDQKYVVVSHLSAAHLRVYQIGPNGSLTPHATTPVVALPSPARNIDVSESRQMIYAACSNADSVVGLSIGSDGSLTSTVMESGLENVQDVIVSPNGNNVYAITQANTQAVAQFEADDQGDLSPLDPGAVDTVDDAVSGIVHPNGKSLYVGSGDNDQISQYTASSGKLAAKAPASLASGNGATFVFSIERRGKYLFRGLNSPNIGRAKVASDGRLTALTPVPYSDVLSILVPYAAPDADILYLTAPSSDKLALYDIQPDGSLVFRELLTVPGGLLGLAFAEIDQP